MMEKPFMIKIPVTWERYCELYTTGDAMMRYMDYLFGGPRKDDHLWAFSYTDD